MAATRATACSGTWTRGFSTWGGCAATRRSTIRRCRPSPLASTAASRRRDRDCPARAQVASRADRNRDGQEPWAWRDIEVIVYGVTRLLRVLAYQAVWPEVLGLRRSRSWWCATRRGSSVTSQKHQAWDAPSRSAPTVAQETKHRRPDPAFKPPRAAVGVTAAQAGTLLAAVSSAFRRIRSASRGTLPRPRTRSWRSSQKLTPNRRHVFFKLAKVSRARRPKSLRVLPLIFRFLT